jgi:hypothetical protein
MKVYIAGKITGLANYRELFNAAEEMLRSQGHEVINPAVLPTEGFEHHEYLHINRAMIDVCDAVYFLSNWPDSKGAIIERTYAIDKDKIIWDQRNMAIPQKTTHKKGIDVLMENLRLAYCPQHVGLTGKCSNKKIAPDDCNECWENALAEDFYD